MVDVRGFEVWTRQLVVAAILIQPRNWVRVVATVGGHGLLGVQAIIRIRSTSESGANALDFRMSQRVWDGCDWIRGTMRLPPINEIVLEDNIVELCRSYSEALAAKVSTTAMFCSSSGGRPWRSFKYSGLL
jgi:hypothetical protein